MKPWTVLSSAVSLRDEWISVRSDRCQKGDGTVVDPFHIIEGVEWVCICALTDHGEVVLVREYRHGARAVTIGLPGGVTEPTDSDFASAARRELEEETGYRVRDMIPVGRAYANWANQDNQISYFIGLGATPSGQQNLDPSEDIETLTQPFATFAAYDGTGPQQTHHAAALFYVLRWLNAHPDRNPLARSDADKIKETT